jgi:SAM-dependent methyltransferase
MIKPQQDAFGRAMYDYYRGQGGFEIIERDDGCVDISYGPEQYLAPYPKWPAHQRRALRYARGRVLDIGCGAGRHALYLQEKGFDVLGIDISPLAIKVCRGRGLKRARILSINDISARLGAFDTLIMFCNNFGLFGNPDRARRLLRRFHRLTPPGARILAESLDYRRTTEPDHIAYQKRNVAHERLPGQLRIRIRYKRFCTPWFEYLFVTHAEMRRILAGTGWRIARFLNSDGPRYIAVIEKDLAWP